MADPDQIYDALIIGAGHAGLSAALTLYRQQHTSLIFDSGSPRNSWPTPTHALPGWEGSSAEDLRAASRKELQNTGLASFVESKVEKVVRTRLSLQQQQGGNEEGEEDGFEVTDSEGRKWRGRKVLLAIGKQTVWPDIPGYRENYPEKIFHCLFTFGYEARGSSRAGLLAWDTLGSGWHAATVANDALKFVAHVTVYTNGDAALGTEIAERLQKTNGINPNNNNNSSSADSLFTICNRPVSGLKRSADGQRMVVLFSDSSSNSSNDHNDNDASTTGEDKAQQQQQEEDFLVHQPNLAVDKALISQLDLELTPMGEIKNTPPFFATNVSGVFAAGDCATPFKVIAMAQFMGANAGVGIAREIPAAATRRRGVTAETKGKGTEVLGNGVGIETGVGVGGSSGVAGSLVDAKAWELDGVGGGVRGVREQMVVETAVN